MKTLFAALTAATVLAGSLVVATAPAEAYVVEKTIRSHHGVFGHGCRTVRTVRQGPRGRVVSVRKVCR